MRLLLLLGHLEFRGDRCPHFKHSCLVILYPDVSIHFNPNAKTIFFSHKTHTIMNSAVPAIMPSRLYLGHRAETLCMWSQHGLS